MYTGRLVASLWIHPSLLRLLTICSIEILGLQMVEISTSKTFDSKIFQPLAEIVALNGGNPRLKDISLAGCVSPQVEDRKDLI